MDIKKSDRATLKSYFVRNAVPTAGNFEELVDGAINQREDGIAKLPGEPLSVQADGDNASQKKALNFYKSFADAKPAWTLSLNPRAKPADPATARPGWSLGDAEGNSKLFIDESTGNVGIGTADPGGCKLNVQGPIQVVDQNGDANGGSLLLGVASQSNLRLGCHADYSWVQSHGGKPLAINPLGNNVGIGTTAPEAMLAVNGIAVVSNGNGWAVKNKYMAAGSLTVGGIDVNYGGGTAKWHANTAALLLETANNTEIAVHDAGKRVASLMYYEGDTANRLTIGRNMGWDAIGQVVVAGNLEVAGVLKARSIQSTNPMQHRMYPSDPLVYQDILEARDKFGAIKRLGGGGYNDTSYVVNPWNDRRIIMFGNDNEADGNGAEITIPAGYDTVWVRVLGERWAIMKAYFLDGGREDLGLWAGGYRRNNCYCPDGSLSDGYQAIHQWVPIAAGRAGRLALVPKVGTNSGFWLSGVAFSRNPWAHAVHPAISYHWKHNGSTGVEWGDNGHDWNNDCIARVMQKGNSELVVPVVRSGRDKLLYLIEHNNNWNGTSHNGITVSGKPIERFLASYDNPFARHWNSKYFQRYIAARIPADLIGGERYLRVKIDMSMQADSIYFREAGTHDLDVPLPA